MPEQRSDELLRCLVEAGVEFVVVGGVAAIAHGMDRSTKDLDIVANMTTGNMARLLTALAPYGPKHLERKDLGVISVDRAEHLAGSRFILIATDIGRVDVLARVEPVGAFSDLDYLAVELLPSQVIRVVTLDQLIQIKSTTGRPRDLQDAQELKALRELVQSLDEDDA